MSDEFDFSDLTEQSEVITFKDRKCLLKEASGATVAKFRNQQLQGATFSDGKIQKVGTQSGELSISLVSDCLYDETGNTLMGKSFVSKLQNPVLEKLFAWIVKVSGLGDDAPKADDLKNS